MDGGELADPLGEGLRDLVRPGLDQLRYLRQQPVLGKAGLEPGSRGAGEPGREPGSQGAREPGRQAGRQAVGPFADSVSRLVSQLVS